MVPFTGERPRAHTVPFPTAPAPTNTAFSVSFQLSFGTPVGVSPFSHKNVDRRTSLRGARSDSGNRTCLKIPPTARQAAAPAPRGFCEDPVGTGPLIESKASQPSLPAKYVVSKPGFPEPIPIPIE